MTAALKVLHVETGMNLYGGALQVFYLLRGLKDREDVENALVCPEGSAVGQASRNLVKTLHAVPMGGDLDLPFVGRLTRIIRKERPDIVHLHSRRGADVLGGIAAKLTGTRCVLTRRVDNPEKNVWAQVKYRLYNHVITISEGIREILAAEGVPEAKLTCVPSAVDAGLYRHNCDREWFSKEFGIGEDHRVCGTVAQLIGRKGHRFLLKAVPGILESVPKARFLFFGKGPLEDQLRSRCQNLGIEKQVLFPGFREDLDRIIGCLDLVIHPALMEGLGVSLLQAAAAGVPIVGTRVGGIPEIVRHGVNGYLIPPADAAELVAAATGILSDPDLARRMGENGKRIVDESFSIHTMVEGNMRVYREMMVNFRNP